ncbi:MAG: IPT/TIG domain-containing protein, partial [Myxococcota bacterium]
MPSQMARLHHSRLVLWLALLALAIAGCGKLEEAIEEEAEERVRERAGNGVPIDTGNSNGNQNEPAERIFGEGPGLVGNQCPEEDSQDPDPGDGTDAIEVNRLEPNFGLIAGGEVVTVVGLGFREGDVVSLGGAAATTTFFDENRLEIVTPARGEPGLVNVTVRRPSTDEAGELPAGYQYYEEPVVDSISPVRASVFGGETLTLTGQAFSPGTEVFFGDVQAQATVISETEMLVTAPPLAIDVYTVAVVNAAGRSELQDVYKPFEPVRLTEVRPLVVDLAGGSNVLALGQGFGAGSEVTVGGEQVSPLDNDFRERELLVSLNAGSAEGAANVFVSNDNGSAFLRDGVVFIDFSDSTPRIVETRPRIAPTQGGSELTIVGVGFDDPDVAVTIGGQGADCFTESSNIIRCVAPPGLNEQVADINVISGTTNVTQTDAIAYTEYRIDAVVEDRGSLSGGTFVTVYGSGFDDSTELFFDGQVARDIVVENPGRLVARTPPGLLGLSDVSVTTAGLTRTEEDAFEYVDPALELLFTAGGPIVGSVNITAFDSATGSPVPDAFVMLGNSANPVYSGLTDARGQITFSGPDVYGPVTVTVARSNFVVDSETEEAVDFTTFSYVNVNSKNLQVVLFRSSSSSTAIPGGGAGLAPLVRGNVIRLKDQFNDDTDQVRMI